MKTVDGRFEYEDRRFSMGSDCACHLRIWQLADGRNVVLATELEPSPGASVTNTAERWATQVCNEYGLDPTNTTFIEHYARPDEVFDFVTFSWDEGSAFDPKWKRGGRSAVEALVGEIQ